MSFELGITLLIAVLGVLNVVGTAGLWFKLGSLTKGQALIEEDVERLYSRAKSMEDRVNVLDADFRSDLAHNRESGAGHRRRRAAKG